MHHSYLWMLKTLKLKIKSNWFTVEVISWRVEQPHALVCHGCNYHHKTNLGQGLYADHLMMSTNGALRTRPPIGYAYGISKSCCPFWQCSTFKTVLKKHIKHTIICSQTVQIFALAMHKRYKIGNESFNFRKIFVSDPRTDVNSIQM